MQVQYHAEIELKGMRRIAAPFAALGLHKAGKQATEGLTWRLAGEFV